VEFLSGVKECGLQNMLLDENALPSVLDALSGVFFSNLIVL
jgi:hypothetical protein